MERQIDVFVYYLFVAMRSLLGSPESVVGGARMHRLLPDVPTRIVYPWGEFVQILAMWQISSRSVF